MCGGSNARQEDINKIESEGSDDVCNNGLILQPGDDGTHSETTENAGLREQLGQEDCRREDRG